jgi:MFS family permease
MPAVNRFGARRVLQWAGAGAALVCSLLPQADTPLGVGAGLLGLGVLLGLSFNLVEAWVNAILPDARRGTWLALHCTLFTLFQLSGPLLLQWLPGVQAYAVCAALLLLAMPICSFLNERSFDESGDNDATTPAEAPEQQRWWTLLLTAPAIVWSTALFALFDALVLSLLPIYGRQHGLDESLALLSASVVLAGDTALEWLVGLLADRCGRLPVHLGCAVLLLLAAPLLPLAVGHWLWWPLLFLIGGAAGGIYVLSLMASGQRYSGRRLLRMTALLGAAWGAASCVGPLLTGVLMQVSVSWALPGVLLGCAAILLPALAWEEFQLRRQNVSEGKGQST